MKHLLTLIALLLVVGVQGGYIQKKNDASDYNYKRAMEIMDNDGNPDEALKWLNKQLQENPKHGDALIARAMYFYSKEVYGRRRVGKTYLIRQHFKNQFAFDMTGVMEGSKSEQMTAFHTALKTYGYKGKKNQNWIDAFFALRQLLESKIESGKRCVIFID